MVNRSPPGVERWEQRVQDLIGGEHISWQLKKKKNHPLLQGDLKGGREIDIRDFVKIMTSEKRLC